MQSGDDEYLLLVALKRLYELQLSRSVPIESLYEEIGGFLHRLSNLDDEVCAMKLPPAAATLRFASLLLML